MELGTERVNGMGIGSIPITKIWMYLDRFDLPDWWEPILLQCDAQIIAASSKEAEGGRAKPTSDKRNTASNNRTNPGQQIASLG